MTEKTPSRIRYEAPPIQEAICELHFELPKPLDREAIQRMQAVWQSQYPNQQVVTEKSLEVRFGMEGVDTTSNEVGHKLIARSADEKDLAQMGKSFVAVNRLKPYLGWEESFRDTILQRLREVTSVYGFERISRIGLRYINRIDLPQHPARWADWFTFRPPVPADMGDCGGEFAWHFRHDLESDLKCSINFVTLPQTTPAESSVILDIDVIWRGSRLVSESPAGLETVHLPHRKLFEGYVLDKTRNLFHIKQ